MSITTTNTLATITNGTNIYLQQQITTTSNIINTNFITESITNTINQTVIISMPVDGWVIFGSIATVVSAIFMGISVWTMKKSIIESSKQMDESRKQFNEQMKMSYASIEAMRDNNNRLDDIAYFLSDIETHKKQS